MGCLTRRSTHHRRHGQLHSRNSAEVVEHPGIAANFEHGGPFVPAFRAEQLAGRRVEDRSGDSTQLVAPVSRLGGMRPVMLPITIWTAIVLAAYIIGLSYIARKESTFAALKHWPCLFLAAPLVFSWIINQGANQLRATVLAIAVALWMLFRLDRRRPPPRARAALAVPMAGEPTAG